jgi:hypothetical protein
VLKDVQKPLAILIVSKAPEAAVKSSFQDKLLQTPVTAEDIAALHSLIAQDAQTLDETSRNRLQKLANAAHVSLAKRALLHDENRLLFKQNDEAKRRWSTKSTIVGNAKVMSYEDIEEAKAKRAVKDAVKDDAAGKRGRKVEI